MKTSVSLAILFCSTLAVIPSFAQAPTSSPAAATSPAASPSGQPTAEDMQKMMTQMMELSKLNENHKLLADLAGTWTYTVKMWMNPDPNAKPEESKGTAVRKSMMDGRYFRRGRDWQNGDAGRGRQKEGDDL